MRGAVVTSVSVSLADASGPIDDLPTDRRWPCEHNFCDPGVGRDGVDLVNNAGVDPPRLHPTMTAVSFGVQKARAFHCSFRRAPVDPGPEWDIDADASMVAVSLAAWECEKTASDERISAHASLDSVGAGNRRTVRWNVQKLISEYARHNGHADLLRERIDDQTGE
jgi:hypothetical protein